MLEAGNLSRPALRRQLRQARRSLSPLQQQRAARALYRQLRASEKAWREERAHLIEKNEMARLKVEAMISRLKALEQDS